ncbi:hypothetical protein LJB94_02350 [Odoribacter sp. OttesenSCG-928-G04]|nr:hypothetical protein [Odoribacter sp. OttesenSCG-928-G04]
MTVFILTAIAVGIILGAYLFFRFLPKASKKKGKGRDVVNSAMIDSHLNINASDIAKLAHADYIVELDMLVESEELEVKMPEFYQKLSELNKRMRDKYFQNLLEVLIKGNEEWLNDALISRPELSVQDILLILLDHIGFDNKTIAQMLFVSLSTLKKRKTRLNTKLKLVAST